MHACILYLQLGQWYTLHLITRFCIRCSLYVHLSSLWYTDVKSSYIRYFWLFCTNFDGLLQLMRCLLEKSFKKEFIYRHFFAYVDGWNWLTFASLWVADYKSHEFVEIFHWQTMLMAKLIMQRFFRKYLTNFAGLFVTDESRLPIRKTIIYP